MTNWEENVCQIKALFPFTKMMSKLFLKNKCLLKKNEQTKQRKEENKRKLKKNV